MSFRLFLVSFTCFLSVGLPVVSAGTPDDLFDDFADRSAEIMPIMPPSPSFPVGIGFGTVGTDFKTWPKGTQKLLLGVSTNGVTAYPFAIARDPKTDALVLYNANADSILERAADEAFSRDWYVAMRYPAEVASSTPTAYGEWLLGVYDPCRVYAVGLLLDQKDVETFRAAASLRAASLALMMPVMMQMSTPATNLCITSFSRTATNTWELTLNIPSTQTNDLAVITSTDLVWWDKTAEIEGPWSTNVVAWLDSVTNRPSTLFYTVGDIEIDSDDDGFTDLEELYIYHTCPTNAASFPARISGTISYTGPESGTIRVIAATDSNSWSLGHAVVAESSGVYTNERIAVGRDHWVRAYLELTANAALEPWEPLGEYPQNALCITQSTSGVDFSISDVPSAWGSINYAGSMTGDVYIVLSTNGTIAWQSYQPWLVSEGQTNMWPTSTNTYLSFPFSYGMHSFPADTYSLHAFMDADSDGIWDVASEPAAVITQSVTIARRLTFPDVTLSNDADGDGMSNADEDLYGFNPLMAGDAFEDADGDGYLNIYETFHDADPLVATNIPAPTHTLTYVLGGTTIQSLIDASTNDYDIIRLDSSWYWGDGNRALDLKGKTLMLTSSSGDPALCELQMNTATRVRGLILNSGEGRGTVIRGVTISGADAYEGHGAGMLCSNSSPTVISCVITDCRADFGGGVACIGQATAPVFRGCVIMDSRAGYGDTYTYGGGGVACLNGAAPLFSECTINRNAMVDLNGHGCGAGVYCSGTGLPRFVECTISFNTNSLWEGGAMYSDSGSAVTLIDSTVAKNTASCSLAGAGVGSGLVEGCMVVSNCISGPAIYTSGALAGGLSGEGATITDSVIAWNSATLRGGGIHGSDLTITDCLIFSNTLTHSDSGTMGYSGSAIYTEGGTIEGCAIFGNQFATASPNAGAIGSGISWLTNSACASDLVVRNCTIVENDGFGIDVRLINATAAITNCIVYNNSSNQIASTYTFGASTQIMEMVELAVAYFCVEGGQEGTYNIAVTPLLAADRLHLHSPFSPCRGQGIAPVTGIDFDGEPRSAASEPDIGADVWVDSDGDGMPDWWEHAYFGEADALPGADPDNDDFTNLQEYIQGTDPLTPSTITGTPWTTDTDGDGLSDALESWWYATAPDNWDTDGDTLADGWEASVGLSPVIADDPDADPDDDGLSNAEEQAQGTSPSNPDSDDDGIEDGSDADPNDPDNKDPVNAATTTTATLTVGDISGSHSELYRLTLGDCTVHMPMVNAETNLYAGSVRLARGRSYDGVVTSVPDDDDDGDYDADVTGNHLVIDDPWPSDGSGRVLGGHHEDSGFNGTDERPFTVYVLAAYTNLEDTGTSVVTGGLQVIRGVDIDVDSDNDDGYGMPDRTVAEDSVEDVSCAGITNAADLVHPGKVLYANIGDSDGDGIPGYADGFDLGSTILDNGSRNDRFAPLVLAIPENTDLDKALLGLEYSGSDPAEVIPYQPVPGSGVIYIPDSGMMRLWTEDADTLRDKRDITAGGDYVGPGVYTPAELGFKAGENEVTLYIEMVVPVGLPTNRVVFAYDRLGKLLRKPPQGVSMEEILPCDAVRTMATRPEVNIPRPARLNSTRHCHVTRLGVPISESDPAGEITSDRPTTPTRIDMYTRTPSYGVTDAALAAEGGRLALEFRRTAGIHHVPVDEDGPASLRPGRVADELLGPGWSSSLGSRVRISRDASTGRLNAAVRDETGAVLDFVWDSAFTNGTCWRPDVSHTFNAAANWARLSHTSLDEDYGNRPWELTLTRRHGTELHFELASHVDEVTYLRLKEISDPDGNTLRCVYPTNTTAVSSLLPSSIYEVAHPAKQLAFGYVSVTNHAGHVVTRLGSVTDALGRTTAYRYHETPSSETRGCLKDVLRPAVPVHGYAQDQRPTSSFTYRRDTIPATSWSDACYAFAPATITSARGYDTSFVYELIDVPTFTGFTFSTTKSLLLTAVTTQKDGATTVTANFGDTTRSLAIGASGHNIKTWVTDTRGVKTEYEFLGPIAINGDICEQHVTTINRRTVMEGDDLLVTFTYSADNNANLLSATGVDTTVISYAYGSGVQGDAFDAEVSWWQGDDAPNHYQCQGLPSQRVIDPTGLAITNSYRYETGFNRRILRSDPTGIDAATVIDDLNGRPLTVVSATNVAGQALSTGYHYDSSGFRDRVTDAEGNVTRFVKDTNGYLLHTIQQGKGGTEFAITNTTYRNVMGIVTNAVDPRGAVTVTEHDALDRVLSVTLPAVGGQTSRVLSGYDLDGNAVSNTVENGANTQTTIRTFDPLNRVLSERLRMTASDVDDDDADIITSNSYNQVGLPATVTDAEGNVASMFYDEMLRVTNTLSPVVTLPTGATTRYGETFQYGGHSGAGLFTLSAWNPVRTTNRRGYCTDTRYDAAWRPVRVIRRNATPPTDPEEDPDDDEPTTLTTYNAAGDVLSATTLCEDFGGTNANRVTWFFYDVHHRLTAEVVDMDGDGPGTLPTWVNDPVIQTGFDADDLVTRHVLDGVGNETRTIDAEGHSTWRTFDGLSRLTEEKGEAVTLYIPGTGYVADQQPTVSNTYDAASNLILTSDPNGNRTRTDYDARSRPYRTILDLDGDGQFETNGHDVVTSVQYDMSGSATNSVDPRGNSTVTAYDRALRPIAVTLPAVYDAETGGTTNPVICTAYNRLGLATNAIDPRGVRTVTVFDELSRQRLVRTAVGTDDETATTTEFDANNNVVAVTLSNVVNGVSRPQRTDYVFDCFDRRTQEQLPNGGNGRPTTTTTYYRNGLVRTVTDAELHVFESEFDRANRLVESRSRPSAGGAVEETREFLHNGVGIATNITDACGSTAIELDALYRTMSETRNDAGFTAYTTTSGFDAAGNRTWCQYPQTNGVAGGRSLVSRYDRRNLLASVTDGEDVSSYVHDLSGNRLSLTLPNGNVTTNTFDALNRLSVRLTRNGTGTTVHAVTNEHDLVGNRLTVDEFTAGIGVREREYAYDDAYRMTEESWTLNSTQSVSYAYGFDLAGNRLAMTNAVDGVINVTTYACNDLNQLTNLTAGASSTTYLYSQTGNRTNRTVGAVATRYAFDLRNRLVAVDLTSDGTDEFTATYDYRTRRVSKVEGTTTNYFRYDGGVSFHELDGSGSVTVVFVRGSGLGGGIGSILYSDRPSGRETFVYSPLGHTVATVDDSGTVGSSQAYEAFGAVAYSSGSSANNRLANTKERDSSISLDNHGFRYYEPETGRYLTTDPIGYGDGLNVYLYVRGNPINFLDALGLLGGDTTLGHDDAGATVRYLRSVRYKMGQFGPRVGATASENFDGVTAIVVGTAAEGGVSMIPVVGEMQDFTQMMDPSQGWKSRLMAGGSLGLNVVTSGLLPNWSALRAGKRGVNAMVDASGSVDEVAEGVGAVVEASRHVDEGVEGVVAASKGAAPQKLPNGPGAMNSNEPFRQLGDLEPIHKSGMNPITENQLKQLSDDDLLRTVTNPLDGQMPKVREGSNRLLDGNTRIHEMNRRGFDPATTIPVDEL